MTKLHLKYALVNMLDNECEDCDTCEHIETDLNDAMERLDEHLQIVSPIPVPVYVSASHPKGFLAEFERRL